MQRVTVFLMFWRPFLFMRIWVQCRRCTYFFCML